MLVGMNRLPLEKRVQILGLLVEGASLRAGSRITGVEHQHRDQRLLEDAGRACACFPLRQRARREGQAGPVR